MNFIKLLKYDSFIEKITIDVEEGDTVYMGRFKNKKTVIKKIDKDETGMPTINGKKVVNFRIQEPKKNPNFKGYRNRFKKKKINENFDVGKEDIILLLGDNELIELKSIDFYNTWNDLRDKSAIEGQAILDQLRSKKYSVAYFLNLFDGASGYEYVRNLISKKDRNDKFSIVKIDFYHPKMIRGSSFQYLNYIKSTIKKIFQPIHTMNDVECFMCIDRINYMDDPIANIYIILVNAE